MYIFISFFDEFPQFFILISFNFGSRPSLRFLKPFKFFVVIFVVSATSEIVSI